MKLSQQEQMILWSAQHAADAALSEIARKIKMREHVVRAALQRLEDRGAIVRMTAINISPLGYENYDLYFSTNIGDPNQRETFERTLISNESIAMVVELGGEFEYCVTLCAKSIKSVSEFFQHVCGQFGAIFTRKALALRNSYYGFGRKYLIGRTVTPIVALEARSDRLEIDEIDHRILQQLSELAVRSHSSIARTVGIPVTTLAYRIQKLKEKRIIERFIFGIEFHNEGILRFRAFLSTKDCSHAAQTKLFNYCSTHPQIVNFVTTVGPWDYEIGIEISHQEELKVVARDLQATIGTNMNAISLVPIYRIPKVRNYPFKNFRRGIDVATIS